MIDGILGALQFLVEWPNPAWVVGGVLFGMLIGFLPGMAGSVALALLIPVSFMMDAELAVLFLIGAYSPAGFGGMLTSILVNTPGAPENAATTFDGYPMAKQGRAGAAIGAATAASVLGGLIGTVLLLAAIPLAQRFVLALSYPEFLMMAVLGLTVIAVVTERSTPKGLVAAGAGFLLAFIGLDPITGSPRFAFGHVYLWDGINIVPVLIGLFAGAEVLALFGRSTAVAQTAVGDDRTTSFSATSNDPSRPVHFWEGVRATFQHWFLVVRTSLIGTVIGVIPGVGGAVSGFLAYSHAKQTSHDPEEFGQGSVKGVISAESANDAKESGSLLPTVAFGIPGTVGMAVLLGALILHGVPAGPTILVEHANLIYILVVGMAASKFVAPVIVWLVAKQAGRLTGLRPGVFTPLIAVAALVGTFTVRANILDVVVALIFGYVGYAMRRYGFSRVALIIALVLGVLVERSYYQMVATFGSPSVILTRPISATLAGISAIVLIYAVIQALQRLHTARMRPLEDDKPADEAVGGVRQPGRLLFDALLLALAITIVVLALSIETDAATMPLLLGVPLGIAVMILLVLDLVPSLGRGIRTWVSSAIRPSRSSDHIGGGEAPGSGVPQAPDEGRSTIVSARRTRSRQDDEGERQVLLRQAAFGLWAVGFVALSWLVGFVISIPVALLFFLLVLAREPAVRSVAITVGMWLFLYGLFDVGLGVPLS